MKLPRTNLLPGPGSRRPSAPATSRGSATGKGFHAPRGSKPKSVTPGVSRL